MLTTLKNILKLKFSIALIIFSANVFYAHANIAILTKKYTYGDIAGGEINILESNITETDDNYITFLTGEKISKEKYNIELFATLKVKIISDKVLASITFKNKSQQNLYIYKINLPYNRDTKNKYYFNSLCEDMFSIFSDKIKLDFLGRGCQLDDMEWVKIAPQQEMSFTIILNNSYLFLPGKHYYRMKTAKYLVVDNSWFTTEKINKTLFSIVDFNYPQCELRKHSYLFQRMTELCKADPWRVNSLRYFMKHFFSKGNKNDSYYKISSNKVSIKIDGDNIKSFYDIPNSKRS